MAEPLEFVDEPGHIGCLVDHPVDYVPHVEWPRRIGQTENPENSVVGLGQIVLGTEPFDIGGESCGENAEIDVPVTIEVVVGLGYPPRG